MEYSIWWIIIICIIFNILIKKRSCQRDYNTSFEKFKKEFYDILKKNMKASEVSYDSILDQLSKVKSNIDNIKPGMKQDHSIIIMRFINENYLEIEEMNNIIQGIKGLNAKINSSTDCFMMIPNEYGKVNRSFYDKVKNLKKESVIKDVECWEREYETERYNSVFNIEPEVLASYLWFWAMLKPFSSADFNRINRIYSIVQKTHFSSEAALVEMYYTKQMGATRVIKTRVQDIIKENKNKDLSLIQKISKYSDMVAVNEALFNMGSALMWMKEYEAERIVLEYMLVNKIEMPIKLQERLYSLSQGGEYSEEVYDVESSGDIFYVDMSALVWKEKDYIGRFENLAFQEKKLSYSLAIRDEEKTVLLMRKITIPELDTILDKFNMTFVEEYGDAVEAKVVDCVALSGSGKEQMKSILVTVGECKHMGILVHIIKIGKQLTIKFHTIFIPDGGDPSLQKQQALSMFNKTSLIIVSWEKSLKEIISLAVERLLNSEPEKKNVHNSEPLF